MRVDFAAAFSQIIDQLFARLQLPARRLVAIEIANQANAQCDIVQIVAVHVTAIDLTPPSIAHFDLSVAGRSTIADNKVVSEPIFHSPNMPVIIIENAGAALSCPAIVNNDELPPAPQHRRAIDFISHRS